MARHSVSKVERMRMMIEMHDATARQRRRTPSECKICGGLALYSYFGLIAYPSCKMFLRRHAKQNQVRFDQCLMFY